MAQIFISYRRGPTGYVAHLLAEQIKAEFGPKAVFMDIDNVPLGVDFRDYIGAAVSDCQVLLVLIGDDWLTARLPDGTRRIDAPGDFVRVEIEAALQRGIPVVPILTNTASIPVESELPASLRLLAFRNAAELRSGRDLKSQMQGLISELSLATLFNEKFAALYRQIRFRFSTFHLFSAKKAASLHRGDLSRNLNSSHPSFICTVK